MKYFPIKTRFKLFCLLSFLLFTGLECSQESLVTGDCIISDLITRLIPDQVYLSQGETRDIVIEATALSNCQEWYADKYSVHVISFDQLDVAVCVTGNLTMNTGVCTVSVTVPPDQANGNYFVVLRSVMSRDSRLVYKDDTLAVNVIPDVAGFNISVSPSQISIAAGGGSAATSLAINRTGGHSANINLSLDNVPSGVSYSLIPNPVPGNSNSSQLTITTDQTVSSNTYSFIVKGNDGTLERSTGLQLTIGAPANPWFQQTSGVNENLTGVHFIDTDNGYAVGNNVKILKTTDGGVNWSLLSNPPPVVHFKAVQFINMDRGYVVGTGGGIYFTQNGGGTWQNKSITDVLTDQNDLYFINQQNGWVAGRHLYFTFDGGITWQLRLDYDPPRVWNSIAFTGSSNGVVVGAKSGLGKIFYTTNNGINWTESSYPSSIPEMNDVCFINSSTAYAVGRNTTLLKSTDSGQSWIQLNSNINGTIWGITFSDELNGWIVGAKIWRTFDGGQSWIEEETPPQTLYKSYFINNETGYAVGSSGLIMRRK